jgi:hypothetical protein
MYILDFIKEVNIWRKVRQIAKENEKDLNQEGFRVDWIGRIYTVINLPEEVINQPISREGYVLMKLREYDRLFLNMGIADVISPELVELADSDAYLLILSPDRDYVKLKPFLWWLTKTTGVIILLRVLYNIGTRYGESIIDFFTRVFQFIF